MVVPRLTVELAGDEKVPIGEEVWQGTRLPLPADLSDIVWRRAIEHGEIGGELLVGSVLRALPVELLIG